jgi:hypothetical protein
MARPVDPAGLVERLDGSDLAKRRLTLVLQTLVGDKSVPQACAELDICEAMFHKMRSRTLRTALSDLEPKPIGRKPLPQADGERIVELERSVEELRLQARAAEVRAATAALRAPAAAKKTPA